MRDFDEARAERAKRDQGFKMGGQEFRINQGVHPTVFGNYEDAILGERVDLLGAMDTLIKGFLWDDQSRDRWDALRARIEDPVTTGDLRALISYLYEVESDLPTIAPELSSAGRERTKRPSAAERSSRAGAES